MRLLSPLEDVILLTLVMLYTQFSILKIYSELTQNNSSEPKMLFHSLCIVTHLLLYITQTTRYISILYLQKWLHTPWHFHLDCGINICNYFPRTTRMHAISFVSFTMGEFSFTEGKIIKLHWNRGFLVVSSYFSCGDIHPFK